MKPFVYLACPYSHDDEEVRLSRFQAANRVAAVLIQRGLYVFSPISHTHPMAVCASLPLDWDFWHAYDKAFIEHSHTLYVLCIPGWKESTGVNAEIGIARDLGTPVLFIDYDGNEMVV